MRSFASYFSPFKRTECIRTAGFVVVICFLHLLKSERFFKCLAFVKKEKPASSLISGFFNTKIKDVRRESAGSNELPANSGSKILG